MPETNNTGDHRDTLVLLNDELTARLSRQDASGARIDTKATVIMGFAAAAAQFLATQQANVVLAVLAYSFYTLSFVSGLLTLAVARYEDTGPRPMVDYYATEPEPRVLATLVATRVRMFEANARKHRRKAVLWWHSAATLAIGLTLSVIGMGQT